MSMRRDWVKVAVDRYCTFWRCDKCGLQANLNAASDEGDHEPQGWVRVGIDTHACAACTKRWMGMEANP